MNSCTEKSIPEYEGGGECRQPIDKGAEFDLVIRGGKIVDGTRVTACSRIFVKAGVMVEMGSVRGKGRQGLDARGLTSRPGFVDVHSRYDRSSTGIPMRRSRAGTAAPAESSVFAASASRHAAPRTASGRCAGWRESRRFPTVHENRYALGLGHPERLLDSLERAGLGVNVASYVPHSAIAPMSWVKTIAREKLKPQELEQMKELVRDGFRAGALGLSTDHNLINRDYNGAKLPSAIATQEEMEALLSVWRDFNVGSVKMTPPNLTSEKRKSHY